MGVILCSLGIVMAMAKRPDTREEGPTEKAQADVNCRFTCGNIREMHRASSSK